MNKGLVNDYWKISLLKNGELCSTLEAENTDELEKIAFSSKRKGYDVEVKKCNRIEDFLTDFQQFINDNY